MKAALEANITAIQSRAKLKYLKPGDPRRETFYIGQQIGRSRSQLVTVAKRILETLATEALPGVTPAIINQPRRPTRS